MKVALVFPRLRHGNVAAEPLGLLYIAGALRKSGVGVSLFDGTVMEKEEMIRNVSFGGFGYAGFSVQTIFMDDAIFMAERIKKQNPKIKIIFGGPHACVTQEMPKCVDHIVVGEGETTFVEIVKGKLKSRVVHAPPIKNMDDLPFPAREMLSNQYLENGTPNFMLSRGCPFSCAFCQPTLKKIFGNRCRKFSVKRSMEEIRHARRVYEQRGFPVKEYVFQDDAVTYDKKWLREFCESLIRDKLVLPWVAGSRADTLPDENLLRLMKRAGCTKLSIGVESGNEHIRNDILRKGLKQEKIVKAFGLLEKVGIEAHSFLMIGSPDESPLTILETVKLLDEINPASAQVSVTTPIPGTHLYDYCSERDIISARWWADYDYYFNSHINLKDMPAGEISRYRNAVNYAIIFRTFLRKRFGVAFRYETLFFLFKIRPVNWFISSFEKGCLNPLRQRAQRMLGFSLKG